MRKLLLLMGLLFAVFSTFAHVTEIRVNQAQDGSLTWYLSSYHSVGECGIANSGLTINGVNYPLQEEHNGDVANLSPNLFATLAGYAHTSYAIVRTPFLGTTLNVQPYSQNVCWSFLVGGSGNFTPPPPPVCTSCPLTGWSSIVNLPGNNNGTPCNTADDYTTATIQVNHLACANITGDKQFRVVFDPGGANVSYGPYNYNSGVQTDVTINIPSGSNANTQIEVVDDDFPCNITHGLNGSYSGEKDAVNPTIGGLPGNISRTNDPGLCGAVVSWNAPVANDNCSGASIAQIAGPASGTIFPTGTTTVTYRATDAAGNSVTQSFTVTVTDNQPPVIACPFNITVNAETGRCGATVSYNQPSATDNCGSGGLPTSIPGYTYKGTFGGHTYFLSNAGTTPEAAHAAAIALGGHLVTINSLAENQFVSAMSGQFIWIGYTDRDVEGNFKWVTSEPVVYTNWNSGEPNNAGDEDWAVINWGPNGTWNDWGFANSALYCVEFEGGNVPTTLVSGPASGSFFPVGTTTVTYQAIDPSGNKATCNFTVTVLDKQAPVPNVASLPVVTGECSATVTAPTATDACKGLVTATTADPLSYTAQGTYTVHWTYNDGAGNTSTQNQTVIVKDVTPPVVANCPVNISVSTGVGNTKCGQVVNWVAPTATDNCGGVSVTSSHQPGTTFAVGTTTVTYTFTDTHNNVSTCSFTVTVADNTPPTFGITGDVVYLRSSVSAPWGMNGNETALTALYGAAGWKDYRYETVNTAQLFSSSTRFIFMEGGDGTATEMKAFIQANQTQMENWVNSGGKLFMNAAPNEGGNISFGFGGVTLTYPNYTTTGVATVPNHPIFNGPYTPVGTQWMGSSLGHAIVAPPNANMTTLIKNTDNNLALLVESNWGNGKVMFGGMTLPWFQQNFGNGYWEQPYTGNLHKNMLAYLGGVGGGIQANITTSSEVGKCGAVVTYNTPVGTDNCSATTTQTTGLPSGSTFPVGTTTNTFVATDASGNTASYSFTVTVNDTEKPKLVGVPASTTVECTAVPAPATVTASDNCPNVGAVQFTEVKTNGNCAGNYTLTRTWKVTDAHNNTTTATQVVTVRDTKAPVLSVPNNIVVSNDQGKCGAKVGYVATASDNCSNAHISYSIQPGSFFAKGTTTVLVNAVDDCGNATGGSFTVTVNDTENPVITCTGNQTRNTDAGKCSYATVGAEFDPSFGDNCPGSTVSNSYNNGSSLAGAVFAKGTTTVTWTVTDASGNTATCSTDVTVEDHENPVITCTGNQTRNTDAGKCSYATVGTEFDPSFGDNCPGSTVSNSYNNGSSLAGAVFAKGTTTVTWTVTDASGNTATCSTNVTVEDHENPVITCTGNQTRNTNAGKCSYATVGTEFDPSFGDNCPGSTVSNSYNNGSSLAGAVFAKGTTTVTWTVTDASGNKATCTFNVTVEDHENPTIACVSNRSKVVDNAGCSYLVKGAEFDPSFGDNCPGATVKNSYNNGSSLAGASFPKGTTTVTWTVTDASGNTATCAYTVTVTTSLATTISSSSVLPQGVNANTIYVGYTPASTLTLTANPTGGGSGYTYKWTVSGNLSITGANTGSTVKVTTSQPGSSTPYTVTLTVTDVFGCTVTTSWNVLVKDVRCGNNNDKVLVCQKTSSTTNPWVQICIAAPAVATHLANGSTLGTCTTSAARGGTTEPIVRTATINAYPNPTTGVFELQLQNYAKGKVEIQVVDNYGKLIAKQALTVSASTENVTFDVTKHASGVYHVRVVSAEDVKTLRVIVAR